jgi:hypothetical protein
LRTVLQGFLGDAEQGGLDVGCEPAVGDVHGGLQVAEACGHRGDGRAEAEVVEQGRAQPGDGPTRVLQGLREQGGGGGQLLGDGGVVGEGDGGAQVVPGADQPLADSIVDVAGDAAAVELLELEGAHREGFQLGLAALQPIVEHRSFHHAGHQAGHLLEPGDEIAVEVAWIVGVDVEHPDHGVLGPQERHRHERAVVLAPQGRDVAVAGVGPLVLDEGRLAVHGHPPGHALAHGQADGAGHRVEVVGRGAHEDDLAGIVVHHVHEAGVGGGEGHDDAGDLAQHRAKITLGTGDGDDLAQQRRPRRLAGHRNVPSRRARATAWDRSATSSLR